MQKVLRYGARPSVLVLSETALGKARGKISRHW